MLLRSLKIGVYCAVLLAGSALWAQSIDQSRGADPRVNYKELVKYGPWDDRNYQITQEDLAYLSPEEEKLNIHIPAFFRIAMRKAWPELPKYGTGQYPRSAPEIFRKMFGGLLIDGETVTRGKKTESGPLRTHRLDVPRQRGASPVNQEIIVNATTGAAETAIAHNPVNPSLVIAGANGGGGTQEMYYSSDGGLTWNETPPLDGGTCCDPTVAWSSDGSIAYTSTLGACGFSGCGIWFYRSLDNGQTWSPRLELTSGGSDKEYIHVDTYPTSPFKDYIYLTWHDANVMQFVRSRDFGVNFDPIQSFSSEANGIGSDITSDSSGVVYYFWPSQGTRNIWMKKSSDGGGSFDAGQIVADTEAAFDFPLPSIDTRNAFVYVSADIDLTGGPFHDSIYLSWTDTYGPDSDTQPALNHARIQFAYSRDGGASWQINNPHQTSDQNEVDRFHPWMQVDPSGNIHIIFYDTRRDLPNRSRTDMFYTVSSDGGVSWETPIRITAVQSDLPTDSFQYGDYNGLSLTSEQVLPIWSDNRAEPGDPGPDMDAYSADIVNQFSDPNFLLAIDQNTATVCRPDTVQITANIGQIQGFVNPVTLSLGALPAGIAATVTPNPVTPPGQATVEITVDGTVAAGEYPLTLSGAATGSDGRQVAFTLVVQTDPPAPPALQLPLDGEPNAGVALVLLQWNDIAGAVGYRVQVSDDPGFAAPLIDENTTDPAYPAGGFTQGVVYYWRVAAVNACGEGAFGAAFSFTADAETVFLVDQDDNSPNVLAFYEDTLVALGYSFKRHDYGVDGAPTLVDMASHPLVVWFSGDTFAGPDATDIQALQAYEAAGGKIFLASEDFLYPFRPDVPPEATALFGVATVVNDGGDYSSVSGAPGSIFEGMGPYPLDFGNIGLSDFTDNITATAPGTLAMTGDNGNGAAVQTDNTVFMAFPFETIYDGTRATSQGLQEVMATVIDHLLTGCGGSDLSVDAGDEVWYCDNAQANLSAVATGGDGNYTYVWTPSTGLSNPNIANPAATPATPTTYTVSVRDGLNCVATDTVTVRVALSAYNTLYQTWLTPDLTPDVNGDGVVDVRDFARHISECN